MIAGLCALLFIAGFIPGLAIAAFFCAERASLIPLAVWAALMALLACGGMA